MLDRINLPQGAIQQISEDLGINRNTVSFALAGKFDKWSRNYESALQIREYATKKYKSDDEDKE